MENIGTKKKPREGALAERVSVVLQRRNSVFSISVPLPVPLSAGVSLSVFRWSLSVSTDFRVTRGWKAGFARNCPRGCCWAIRKVFSFSGLERLQRHPATAPEQPVPAPSAPHHQYHAPPQQQRLSGACTASTGWRLSGMARHDCALAGVQQTVPRAGIFSMPQAGQLRVALINRVHRQQPR